MDPTDVSRFHYDLPETLIAQHPCTHRTDSRLLCLDGATGMVQDRRFRDLDQLLRPGDLLVLNDTKVVPARLLGTKLSGGRVELLLERVLDGQRALMQIRASKGARAGTMIQIDGAQEDGLIEVEDRDDEFFVMKFPHTESLWNVFEQYGHTPLPPYIARPDGGDDSARYQTVYARHRGAVAAPTAGLHFDQATLTQLENHGVGIAFLTLHVGAGTFQPLRVQDIRQHRMHPEWVKVSPTLCKQVMETRTAGRRVVAVGTTVVRGLESAFKQGTLKPIVGETRLFLYPGCSFQVVDALVTNFHLPGSTLLMLVCAFAGTANIFSAYRHAVFERYRFYSYGDAMFVTPNAQARQ